MREKHRAGKRKSVGGEEKRGNVGIHISRLSHTLLAVVHTYQ